MTGTPLPLAEIADEARFGGKGAQLGAALRAGLPVPPGVGLPVELVDALANAVNGAADLCRAALTRMPAAALAVRSSAVGEDSDTASFAGQHVTCLNVVGEAAVVDAVVRVWRSGRTESALTYRARLGLPGEPRVAVVIQEMVAAECAGVLFTRNPVDGSDERVIEASWGLGEAVVAGLVEPDRYRLGRGGEVKEAHIGDKDVQVLAMPDGHTVESPVGPRLRRVPCLDADRLARLEALAAHCEAVFEGAHDIEWAFAGGRLFLLQRRAVTR